MEPIPKAMDVDSWGPYNSKWMERGCRDETRNLDLSTAFYRWCGGGVQGTAKGDHPGEALGRSGQIKSYSVLRNFKASAAEEAVISSKDDRRSRPWHCSRISLI